MKIVSTLVCLLLLILILPIDTHARFIESLELKTLMERSQLVFVGHVKLVEPSGITTELTYPTWEGVIFEWLNVEVEVAEPIKGTRNGEVVHALMLSARDRRPDLNPPGMVEPKVGQASCSVSCRPLLRECMPLARLLSTTTKRYSH